jgi:hypothetical protein
MDTAVKIVGAHGEADGTAAEYEYLAMIYGPRGTAWKMDEQALLGGAGKKYDSLAITLASGATVTVYFDITDYFGKM